MKDDKRWASNFMDLIDGFIRLQLTAENFPQEERFDFIVNGFRKLCADDFERYFGDIEPSYLNNIKNKKSGPYASDAFDINCEYSLLNLGL
jgi:hypothetical protein